MTTHPIISVETNAKAAIEKSAHAYGLSYYAAHTVESKIEMLEKVKEFYLTPSHDGKLDMYYVVAIKNKKGCYRVLHKFSWSSCVHSGAAALCSIIGKAPNHTVKIASTVEKRIKAEAGDTLVIGDYEWNRDDLRKQHFFWTI